MEIHKTRCLPNVLRSVFLWILLYGLVGFCLFSLPIQANPPPPSVTYRGFTFDASRALDVSGTQEVESVLQEQVDKVYAVGLSEDILSFFRSVPIKIVPQSGHAAVEPGLYSGDDKSVQFSASLIAFRHKPVLIHELLHAYHDQKLHKGVQNPEVLNFYLQARSLGAYAAASHMMSNHREYFACSGTTYLFGVTAQEPFKRENIQKAQPEVIEYFHKLFGPNTGSYQGQIPQ